MKIFFNEVEKKIGMSMFSEQAPVLPSEIIFTTLLVLRRTPIHKNIRRKLIAEYIVDTITKVDEYGYIYKYEVVNGIKHGLHRRWYESGQLNYEMDYKDGISL